MLDISCTHCQAGAGRGSWQVTTECVWLLQYFLQRGWSSCSSRGKSSQVSAPAPGLTRVNHRTSASSRTATSNPSDQEVEVCVATLPYVRGRGIPPPNLPKSATTWGPLHKPLIWKVSLRINAVSGLLTRSWLLSSLACLLHACWCCMLAVDVAWYCQGHCSICNDYE